MYFEPVHKKSFGFWMPWHHVRKCQIPLVRVGVVSVMVRSFLVLIYLVEVGEVLQSSRKQNKNRTLQNTLEMMSLSQSLNAESITLCVRMLDSTCMEKSLRIHFLVKISRKNQNPCNMHLFYCAMWTMENYVLCSTSNAV